MPRIAQLRRQIIELGNQTDLLAQSQELDRNRRRLGIDLHFIDPDGLSYDSATPGQLGGNSKMKIYGRLGCWSAKRAIPKGYAAVRVFFADEATAVAAGYRPCGHCMKEAYTRWRTGGLPGSPDFPWLLTPHDTQ